MKENWFNQSPNVYVVLENALNFRDLLKKHLLKKGHRVLAARK